MKNRAIAVLAVVACASAAFADIRITEVSPTGSATFGSDWFELTNFGASAVSITGWQMDDNSFNFANSVALNGISSIGAGESVVFIENTSGSNVSAFMAYWGGLPGVQVGYYGGSGVGLSSGGDGVIIFDSGGTEITRQSFGAAPSPNGVTFGFDPGSATFGEASVDGVHGAFLSTGQTAGVSDVGSPGVIPTPGALALLGIGGVAAARRRRDRR
jgi:MYXO-CTERM domain-containing protein